MNETTNDPDQSDGDEESSVQVGEPIQPAGPGLAEADEPTDEAGLDDPGRPSRIAAWLLMVGSLALAGLFVAIPAHTYDLDLSGRAILDVRRVDFVELWRIQTRSLPVVHYETLLQAFFVVCGLVALVGSAALIWLATVEVVPPSRTDAEPEGRPGDALPSS